ncbi:MAG TPA: hypothetical protein VD838_20840, partial [Anaeromyxobacteraceae bacterium]|nr:hypothetical protein [Anaeromyxobacteraceae bacterium]
MGDFARKHWLVTMCAAALLACSGDSGGSASQPILTLSATSLAFQAAAGGITPAAQTIRATNAGGGTLAKPVIATAYERGTGWLVVTVSGSAAPYAIAVQPAIAGLADGTYTAALSVAVDGAASSPQTVTVALTVGAGTAFTLSGTIRSAAGIAVDGDLADPAATRIENDTFESAQAVPSAV